MISSSRTAPADASSPARDAPGSVHALVDGDVEVGGHAAAGSAWCSRTRRLAASVRCHCSGPVRSRRSVRPPPRNSWGRRNGRSSPVTVTPCTAGLPSPRGPLPGDLADPRRTVCVVRHTSVR
jgi:hypothetical protein